MPKSLNSSRECPDSMADRLASHRFGVFACTVLAVFGSLWIGNVVSVREEGIAEQRLPPHQCDPIDASAFDSRLDVSRRRRVRPGEVSSFESARTRALPTSRTWKGEIADAR